jgi:hypothetical protein
MSEDSTEMRTKVCAGKSIVHLSGGVLQMAAVIGYSRRGFYTEVILRSHKNDH